MLFFGSSSYGCVHANYTISHLIVLIFWFSLAAQRVKEKNLSFVVWLLWPVFKCLLVTLRLTDHKSFNVLRFKHWIRTVDFSFVGFSLRFLCIFMFWLDFGLVLLSLSIASHLFIWYLKKKREKICVFLWVPFKN